MSKVKKIMKSLLITAAAVMCVMFAAETADSIKNSIEVCITVIIPSMFAFMVISSYIIDSGLYRYIFTPAYALLGKIIPLEKGLFSIFLLSLIGGYPTGVKLLKEAISENKNFPEISMKAAAFCYCVSPSFAIIMLGRGVLGSVRAGVLIYISNVLSCFIAAAFVSRKIPREKLHESKSAKSNILIKSINSASASLLTVCSVLIAFNIALTVLKCLIASFGASLPRVLLGSFEISNLLGGNMPLSALPLVSAVSSFGGVCVLFQASSIVNGSFPLKYFLLGRIPCAVLSAVLTWIMSLFWEISAETSTNGGYTYLFSANKAIVPILIIMCIIIFKESEKKFKKSVEI